MLRSIAMGIGCGTVLCFLYVFSLAVPAVAAAPQNDNTFSLVARCAKTGDFAVVVSTARLAVGNRVPFAAPGVAAIATQANTNPELGRKALKLIAGGASAEKALKTVLAQDKDSATRQLSIIDAKGRSTVFTGAETLAKNPWAGSLKGKDCVAAGNLLVGEETLNAMVKAFESTEGFIGERAMKALEAGQAAGGDKRGKISAAILVVRKGPQPPIDLRIDSSKDPVSELRVLYDAYVTAFKIAQ